nr:proline-, glutamic acid- and leucine-rich protein 1-like [Oryza sativa Japonica Group]
MGCSMVGKRVGSTSRHAALSPAQSRAQPRPPRLLLPPQALPLLLRPIPPPLPVHPGLHIRSTRRLPLAPLATSDSFESSSSSAAALDFAEPGAAEESDMPEESYQEEGYAPEAEEEAADDDDEEEAVEASAEVAEEAEDVEEVGTSYEKFVNIINLPQL